VSVEEQAELLYRRWCKEELLDPEDVGSMIAYEKAVEEWHNEWFDQLEGATRHD
jgi:hypothetical protein